MMMIGSYVALSVIMCMRVLLLPSGIGSIVVRDDHAITATVHKTVDNAVKLLGFEPSTHLNVTSSKNNNDCGDGYNNCSRDNHDDSGDSRFVQVNVTCTPGCRCLALANRLRMACVARNLRSVPEPPPLLVEENFTVTILDLSQNNFSTLGDGSFVNYPQLEELNLASNNLINVSTNVFADLTKLHLLNLNGNNLSAVPWRALLDLPELQELYLGDNRIEFIFVGDFQGLLELTTLALEGNLIEFIPVEALQGLLNLKILSLAKNRLSKISDDSFQNLTSLEVLSLASNNIASITPNAFLGLLSLEILELQRNQLHVIPDAIKNLPSLRKLSVAFNHIKYIGEETFRCNSMLAHADLLGNPVILIEHRVFTNLTQLKILIIPEAKELTSFPDLNGTRSLEFLRIERAHLRHVPDDLCHVSYNLKTLDFKSNALEEVPLLTACTELRQLQLSGNQIRSLEGALFRTQHLLHDLLLGNNLIDRILADAFIGLHKLEILNLVGNRITMIHHDAFLPLKQLNYLNVAENRFPQLPSRGLEHVRQLLAFNNPWLRDFPPPSSLPHAHTLKLAYAYHCCQFSSTSGVSSDAASSRSGLLSSGLTETVVWVPKEKVDLSLWATNTSKDLWPVYQNLTHKFGEFADDLWGTMNPDYAYPSNMPQVIEDYMEETRVNEDQRPGHVVSCSPQPGPFMPCEDLFDWWTLRCGIWVVFLLAMLGNGAVVFVLVFSRTKMDVPRFLVCNLACADFCMGVYLGFLAVVDASTLGHFKRHALQWQFSAACQTAGFLGVLSSELSVYTLAVITLERNYAITHAMHLNKRLSLRHAAYIMAGGWAFATFTAALPFFGVSDYRKFAVCLPFDIDAPWSLAYVVFLMAVNGVAFLILMGCYLKMYCAIRGSQAWNSNDSRIAKRMALLVFTDFVCWAPIAFFSLTAAFGLQLVTLEEAKVFTIFVLPLNSCANPFLYAILTKQFKKDCVLICKAIEESRVTRGIGRCRHSSNFSNRQTPANTNSAVVGDRHSLNGQLACSCSRGSSDGGPRRGGPVVGSASAATSAAGLTATQRGRSERHRRWRLSKVRFLLCATAEDIDEPDSACNEYAYAIAEIQKGQQGGGKHGRHLSVSSDNFSSSRSDSWRQKSIPLRLLDKQGRRGSWTIQRKASQDSNLSSSRNDSSATTPSTSTWRVSRSSVSSDMSTGGGGGGASAQRSATAAALVNLRERASSAAAAGMPSSSAGTGVSSPGTPNGDLPPPTSSVVRFALPQDGKDGSSPPPPLTSARPKGKLRRQSAIMEDPSSPPPPSLPLVPQDDRPVAFTGCSVQVTKEVPGDADRDCRRGGADRPSSRHLFAGGWTDALRRHQLMDGGFFPRKLSTISSNSCSLNQESWGAAMQCLGSGGGSGSSSHVLQSRVSADETLRKRLEPSLTGPSERCTSLTNVAKPTPPDPRRAWSDASFHGRSPHPPNDGVWPTWSTDPQKDQTQRSQSDQQLQTQRGRTIWEWSVPIGDLAMGEEAEEEEEVVDIEDLGTCRGLAAEESDPLVGEHRTSTRPRYLEDDV